MVVCSKCGRKNSADAQFCIRCGTLLEPRVEVSEAETRRKEDGSESKKQGRKTGKKIERTTSSFATDVEYTGKRVGKKIEATGKTIGKRFEESSDRFEQRMDNASKQFDSWYDRTFGVFGPLISCFVGLIVLRLIIEILKIQPENHAVLSAFGDTLLSYLLIIFGVMLFASYTSYFAKRHKPVRWIAPFVTAIVVVVLSWIIAHLLVVIGVGVGIQEFTTAVSTVEHYMPMIFTIILLLGYLGVVMMYAKEIEHI